MLGVLVLVLCVLAGAGAEEPPSSRILASDAEPRLAESTSAVSMPRAEFVEWYLATAMLVVGASLLLRPRAWVAGFAGAAQHPLAPLLGGTYALLVGLFVVIAHNLWVADARVLVTIAGWVAAASGALFLLVPEAYFAVTKRLPMTPAFLAFRGLVRIVLGGAVVTYLLTQG